MKVVPDTCTLKSKPSQDGSVLVEARFTMRPDPSMKSIIGQTAHNLDEVCFEVQCTIVSVGYKGLHGLNSHSKSISSKLLGHSPVLLHSLLHALAHMPTPTS